MSKLVHFDWAIKYLLRNKANFDVLEGFLSELLNTDIKIEHILESEGNKEHEKDKFNRVDLLAVTQDKKRVIIEVQCTSEADYLSRILYAASKTVTEHLRTGDKYVLLPKVISVNIVYFDIGQGKDYLYHGTTSFKGIHYQDTLKLNDNEQKLYGTLTPSDRQTPEGIFPEYYIIKVPAFRDKIRDRVDEWVYFLKYGRIEKNFNAHGIQIAAKKLDILSLDEAQRRSYSRYEDLLHSDASFVCQQQLEREISREEGWKKGLEEGQKKGREEGREEGKKENQLKIAKRMIQQGLSLDLIATIVGLPIEQLEILKRDSENSNR